MNDFNVNTIEISPNLIFKQMKENIYKNFSFNNYHSIDKNYIHLRKILFDLLHKIANALGFKSQTFFLTAHYLDIIFNSKEKINLNNELIGLGALSLSAKLRSFNSTMRFISG